MSTCLLSEDAERLLRPCQVRAVRALVESDLAVVVLRLPVASEPVKDVDLLVAPGSLRETGRALAESGFYPKTSPLGIPSKVVFTAYDGERFESLDVHTSVVSRGLVYLDGNLFLRRRSVSLGLPLLSIEDSLLHLVLHPLLGRREIGGKYASRIRQITTQPLDEDYMRQHLSRFGLQEIFAAALAGVLDKGHVDPDELRAKARRQLSISVPGNLFRRCRYRLADVARVRRRSALVAFLGVDGVGKSSLVSALEKRLSGAGLRTTTVYLGNWGRYQTRARWVGSYSPRDAASGESRGQAILRGAKNLVKFGLFYGGLLLEQSVRYWRGVVRTPAHLVLSDRYLYDLEIPFSRRHVRAGRRVRRLIYRLFPAPDLIFHLQAAPSEIRSRKAELDEEQMRLFDALYTDVLSEHSAIPLRVHGTPENMAGEIVDRYWRTLLRACWEHSSRTLLPAGRGALEK